MNIYLVKRTWSDSLKDCYSSFICVAENEQKAREMHPDGLSRLRGDKERRQFWDHILGEMTWVHPSNLNTLEVTLIGIADTSQQEGVILASFHAG